MRAMDPCTLDHDGYGITISSLTKAQSCLLPDGGTIYFSPQRDIPLVFLGTICCYVALIALTKASHPLKAWRRLFSRRDKELGTQHAVPIISIK